MIRDDDTDDDGFFKDPRFAWSIDKKTAAKLGREEIGFLVENPEVRERTPPVGRRPMKRSASFEH